ncbi:hypothetical protein Avbf_07301 [Armadillidium vulgare]|nr:hypothetical protein Avbf_07301 [Armadillidium vulgare]
MKHGREKHDVLVLWKALGGWYYKTPPFSVDECDISNFTSINISKSEKFNHIANNSSENSTADESFLKLLYKISCTFYETISTLLCIIFAVLISFLTETRDFEALQSVILRKCGLTIFHIICFSFYHHHWHLESSSSATISNDSRQITTLSLSFCEQITNILNFTFY